jgi:hypothetical protein
MAQNTTTEPSSKTLETVQKLVKLASDDGATDEERRTAALKAANLMHEHELVVVSSRDLLEAKRIAGEARALASKAKNESQQKLVMGALLGLVGAKFIK